MEIRRGGPWGRRWVVVTTTIALGVAWTAATAAEVGRYPSGTVSLEDAVAAALAHDPVLATYGFEERARNARLRQEGRLPNPTLVTGAENLGRFGGDASQADPEQITVSLTQVVDLGGKRPRRVAIAERDVALAHWDFERARLDTTARVRRAFVAALLAQERVGLAARRCELARDGLAAARRYRDAGSGSAVEVARAEAVLAQQRAVATRRERERAAALAALAATWGDTAAGVTAVAGHLAPLAAPRELAELRAQLAAHPDLARFGDAIARGEADVALEEARRVPDVSVRLGGRRFVRAENNALVAEISVPLPLFDRNADGIAEAQERLEKMRAEQRGAVVAAEAALAAGYAELRAAYDDARTLGADVLPRLAAALAATRRGYAAGTVRQIEVLDAERALADIEEERLAALARYHTTAAELERLTAMPVTGGAR